MDYLVALSETKDGHLLVENLISVYLERAAEILLCAGSGAMYSDFSNFKVSLLHLSIGSDRIGAAKLSRLLNSIVDREALAESANMETLLREVSDEFENARRELQVIVEMLKTA